MLVFSVSLIIHFTELLPLDNDLHPMLYYDQYLLPGLELVLAYGGCESLVAYYGLYFQARILIEGAWFLLLVGHFSK